MKKSEKLKVLIAGGGIGGLCLAQGLRKAGIEYKVFERDETPTSRLQGYRLSLTATGSELLHKNLPEKLWKLIEQARANQIKGIGFVSEELQERWFKPLPPPIDEVRQFASISRVTLREILLTDLGETVEFGRKLVRCELLSGGTVKCIFNDGSSEEGSLLVGADGTHSVVRDYLLPQAARVETGVSAVAGQVPMDEITRRDFLPAPLRESAVVIDKKPQGMFLTIHQLDSQEGEASYVFWSFLTDRNRFPSELETMSPDKLLRLTDEMTEGWHPRLKSLIKRADPKTVMALNYKTSVAPERWASGQVTLIGDAIHSMPPTGGLGANIALEDAAVLCQELINFQEDENLCLDEAVGNYESKMFEYAFQAVESSMVNLRRMVTR